MEDALEMAAQNDWETDSVKNELDKISTEFNESHDDCYHCVSIRIKAAPIEIV